jgi:hypothetical protein
LANVSFRLDLVSSPSSAGGAVALLDSLLSAGVGGLIGTTGTLLAWRTQAKEARRIREEQYDREDRFRLHKERVEAYSAFYVAAGHARRTLRSDPTEESAMEARAEVWHKFTRVLLVGDRPVLDAASDILAYVTAVAHEGRRFDVDHYSELIWRLQATARADITSPDLLPTPPIQPVEKAG